MKPITIPAFLLFLAAGPAAAVVTLGTSTQNFGLTGIGTNAAGQGQSLMSWGSCTFDGTNSTCVLSGPYTGLGPGGTYSFTVSYPGNGRFPLNAVTNPGSNQFFAQSTGNLNFVITLTPSTGSPINFYSFANFNFVYSSPTCTGVSSCTVSQVGVTPNATITGPITGTFDPTPSITPSGALTPDGYGSSPNTAPASWLVMYGVNLATIQAQTWASADFSGIQAPTALAGTTVTIAGLPAYVDYVSPGQVNVQVPSGVPSGSQPIVVTTAGGRSLPYMINVNPVQPGVLAPLSFMLNGHQNVVAQFSNTSTYVFPGSIPGIATARAKPGDNLTMYGIGFGPVTPNIPAGELVPGLNQLQTALGVTFANVPAQITYQGLVPGIVGLYQFNVVVPNIPASDTTPLVFTLGGTPGTQNLVVAIQN
jgi:uncharacterized protein (TIGR03437 family)